MALRKTLIGAVQQTVFITKGHGLLEEKCVYVQTNVYVDGKRMVQLSNLSLLNLQVNTWHTRCLQQTSSLALALILKSERPE